jgi:hypothetical protein
MLKKMTLDELKAELNAINNTTITKRYGIVWIKGNSLIVIIDSFLVLA